jgi:hypothetical protein
MPSRRLADPLDERDRLQHRSVKPRRHAALEIDPEVLRFGGPSGRRQRQEVGILRQHPVAAVRLQAADRRPPEAAIDGILAGLRRHDDAPLGQPGRLGLAGDGLLANGGQHRDGRRQDAKRHVESHLVVARTGRAVY